MKLKKSSMSQLMAAIEVHKDIELPMDPAFYDRLHDKIMARVSETEIIPAHQPWYLRSGKLVKNQWRTWLSISGTLSGLVFAAQIGSAEFAQSFASKSNVVAQQMNWTAEDSLHSPEENPKMLLLSQSDSDFFVDALDTASD